MVYDVNPCARFASKIHVHCLLMQSIERRQELRYAFTKDAVLVLNKDVEKHQGEQFIRPNGSREFPCLFKAKHSRYMLVTEHVM